MAIKFPLTMKDVFRLVGYKKKQASTLKPRIAQRRVSNTEGLYKVLDRDQFYGNHYNGLKNPMKLLDISTTGCAFQTDYYIPAGSYLEVELERLSRDHHFDKPMILACEAVYCQPLAETTKRIGVKFVEMDWTDVEKIRGFTETFLPKSIFTKKKTRREKPNTPAVVAEKG